MLKKFLIAFFLIFSLVFTLASCEDPEDENDESSQGSEEDGGEEQDGDDTSENDQQTNDDSDTSVEENEEEGDEESDNSSATEEIYVYSVNSNRYHLPTCHYAVSMNTAVKVEYKGSCKSLAELGFSPCKICKPDPDYNYDQSNGDEGEHIGEGYILNTDSMKFHYLDCPSTKNIKDENKEYSTDDRDALVDQGYSPCGNCKP